MRALVEVLVPSSLVPMAVMAGSGLSAAVRRRAARRDLEDYLTWLSAEVEGL